MLNFVKRAMKRQVKKTQSVGNGDCKFDGLESLEGRELFSVSFADTTYEDSRLEIVFNNTANVTTAMSDALDRAAAVWEKYISDDITVILDMDYLNMGSSSILGSTLSHQYYNTIDSIRSSLVSDAGGESDDSIVSSLPTLSQLNINVYSTYNGHAITYANALIGTSASFKAMGIAYDPTKDLNPSMTADGEIQFNSNFNFDFDNSDGVTAGQTDFETVAIHEIGHALGFTSVVDVIANASAAVTVGLNLMDMYRFDNGSLPTTASAFTNNSRSILPGGNESFSDTSSTYTIGYSNGVSQQASHFADMSSGLEIGVMDPNLAAGTTVDVSDADLRVLDLIGWDILEKSATPMGLDLVAGSDTGYSSTDNYTNLNTGLEFMVSGLVSGATYKLVLDGSVVDGDDVFFTGSGFTYNGAALVDGVHTFEVVQKENGKGYSDESVALSVTVATGDLNADGVISALEKMTLLNNFKLNLTGAGWSDGDLTGDGVVDVKDYYKLGIDILDLKRGDANGDGFVNLLDIKPAVDNIIIGGSGLSFEEIFRLDIRTDGLINLLDIKPAVDMIIAGGGGYDVVVNGGASSPQMLDKVAFDFYSQFDPAGMTLSNLNFSLEYKDTAVSIGLTGALLSFSVVNGKTRMELDLTGISTTLSPENYRVRFSGDFKFTGTDALMPGLSSSDTRTADIQIVAQGDLDKDGDVDMVDAQAMLDGFNAGITRGALWSDGDLDGDGDVDQADYDTMVIDILGYIRGDMDGSGQIDFGDINPFNDALALSSPSIEQVLRGDINGDGAFDFGDINPFVALLGI